MKKRSEKIIYRRETRERRKLDIEVGSCCSWRERGWRRLYKRSKRKRCVCGGGGGGGGWVGAAGRAGTIGLRLLILEMEYIY